MPDGWGIHFWDYSIGSIASDKFNQSQIKFLKENVHYFEPRSAVCGADIFVWSRSLHGLITWETEERRNTCTLETAWMILT